MIKFFNKHIEAFKAFITVLAYKDEKGQLGGVQAANLENHFLKKQK